ncbi:hypothetical protein [Nocardioides sp. KR10-350]|uniref:hypothetical protein n=1 Tax=Nocardioides cheoyonin TaxID=3156615 RepID=UPI0032B3FD6D
MRPIARTLTLAAGLATTCATLVALAPQASAVTWHITMQSDDGDPGAIIRFQPNGDYVEVCDQEADGYAAFGVVNDYKGVGYTIRAGGNGTCSIVDADDAGHNLHEDQLAYFAICLEGDGGSDDIHYCDSAQWYTG